MKTELNQISTIRDSEITLFRNMSSILSGQYEVEFIGETHQQYVSFLSDQVDQIAIREISDLLIITFSPEKSRMRMTFLQAKYHRGVLDNENRLFNADYFQFELLSKRPDLNRIIGQRFDFPSNILSFSCCNSIGSYGVFFADKNNQIDLAYSSACDLTARSALPTLYSSFKVDLEIPIFTSRVFHNACRIHRSIYPCYELISCFDIDTFTQSLLDLEIGAELTFHRYPGIFFFLRNMLLNTHSNSAVINRLITFIENNYTDNEENNDFDIEGIPTNILIINTDKK